MSQYRIIADNFAHTIEVLSLGADPLAVGIEAGAEMIAQCLLGGNKVMTCGCGADAGLAQLFASHLHHNPDLERPALPVLALAGDCAGLSGYVGGFSEDPHARRVASLGQRGDVLVGIDSGLNSRALLPAIGAAHKRGVRVLALCGAAAAELTALLGAEDLCLQPATEDRHRVQELHLIALNTLAGLIDQSLFGNHSGV